MKESQEQNTIDLFVAFLRKLVDSSRGHWDDWNKQILLVFGVNDHNKLNFIIDSLYLIEDTQLAKSNFREFGASGPTKYKNFGEAYLRIYGIYNACYLQKQAILRIACELNITFDKKTVDSLSIFVYRKIFASHTVNVGWRNAISSYIMNRHDLQYNRVSGVSCNTKDGHDHKSGDVTQQLDEWDVTAEKLLLDIAESALNGFIKTIRDEDAKNRFKTYFKRIINQKKNKTHLSYNSDIWSDHYTSVVFKDSGES